MPPEKLLGNEYCWACFVLMHALPGKIVARHLMVQVVVGTSRPLNSKISLSAGKLEKVCAE